MGTNHWLISRPKRKLILVPELLKIFYSVASGEKWEGNREIQKKYEKSLQEAGWKAQNISKDGSGARTYANFLYMLGLYYEDNTGVFLTVAGQEILNGINPIQVLTKQLLDFQYPSAYSNKPKVNVSNNFRLQPYRFITYLFLEKGFKEITQNDIAFCLVPFAKNLGDLDFCSDLILKYRENPELIIERAVIESKASSDNLKDIGNTAVNQFLYTGFFVEGDDIKSLVLTPEGKSKILNLLPTLRKNLIPYTGDNADFQRKYGRGIIKTKDYSLSKRQPMKISPNEKKIIEQFYIIAINEPIYSSSKNLIRRISENTGEYEAVVHNIISKLPLENQVNQFYSVYLQMAVGGKDTAKEFEIRTTNIFNEGFHINALRVGQKGRSPDIVLYLDLEHKKHGVLDMKASHSYNLPLNHKNIMAHTYIPNFREMYFQGQKFDLSFFGYISGGFSFNVDKSFRELLSMTDIPGHYITAKNFISLLRSHKEIPFSVDEFFRLFSINREIVPDDFTRR